MKISRSVLATLAFTVITTQMSFAVPTGVPEIDPQMGLGMLALLGGAITVIRGRAKR